MAEPKQIRREIGRLLWCGFEGPTVDEDFSKIVRGGDAGGATLFARNLPSNDAGTDLAALRELNAELHQLAQGDFLLSVDQEGGRVQRIKAPATHYPPMLSFSQQETPAAAEASVAELGKRMGSELRDWGFDISFAPVLDVHTNSQNPIIGDRAFATEPELAARLALAYAKGLEDGGMLSCGKHFPGHGDTSTDSHLQLPKLPHDMERLESIELLPFRQAISASLPILMTAHVVFETLDSSCPATLSPRVVTGLLREEMGFSGVVVSDDLDMKAIADNYGVGEASVLAVLAGCDALLLCRNRDHQEQARAALCQEASTSSAFLERVRESNARIDQLVARLARIRPR